jgi:hypothetical protein
VPGRAVDDRVDGGAAVAPPGGDLQSGRQLDARARVHGGDVVDQLGEHVHELHGGRRGDEGRRRGAHLDPAGFLRKGGDVGDHVTEPARPGRPHVGVLAGQQQQALGVAAHPARGVAQLGEAGRLGVELLGLQPLQQPDVPFEPGLQPPRDPGGGVVAGTLAASVGSAVDAAIARAGIPAVGARSGSEVREVARVSLVTPVHQSVLSNGSMPRADPRRNGVNPSRSGRVAGSPGDARYLATSPHRPPAGRVRSGHALLRRADRKGPDLRRMARTVAHSGG